MEKLHLSNFIRLKDYPFLVFAKIYLNGFNVFISIMLQVAVIAATSHHTNRLGPILLVLCIASIIYAFVYYAYSIYAEKLKKQIIESISQQLLSSTLRKVDLNQDNGTMVNLINQDADNVANYFMMGVMPAVDFIIIIAGGLIYSFVISWVMGLVYAIIGIGLYIIAHYFYLKDVKYRQPYQIQDDKQKNFLPDVFNNIAIIRVFRRLNWITNVNNQLFENKARILKKEASATSSSNGIIRGGIYVMEIVSLTGGLLLVHLGQLNFGIMLGIWNVGIGSIFDPFLTLPVILAFVARQKTSLKRINSNLDSIPHKILEYRNDKITKISVDHLSYQYPGNQLPTLKELSFQLNSHHIVFVVGKNGVGKTTLLQILLGVITDVKGKLSVTTENHQELSSLIGHAAFVPQSGQLFTDTIKNNLCLGRKIDNSEIELVLKDVNMFDEINDLPKGLESIFGKDTNFSKGQIRRLSVARALLTHRQYLILDEPFSDIDSHNQKMLMQLFRKLAKTREIIIVTHTYDLMNSSDQVIKVGD